MKNRFKLISGRNLLFLFVLFSLEANAQLSSKEQQHLLDSLLIAYPNDDVIVLENKTEIRALIEKKKATYKKTESETYMILRESGIEKLRNIEIPVYSEDKIDRSECYSINLNGHKSLPHFVGISDRISESFVFYDGGKVAKFEYFNLSVGTIVSYSVVVNTLFPELPTIHVVSDYRPCLKSEFSVICDDAIEYGVLEFNTDSLTIVKNDKDQGIRNQSTWEFSSIGQYQRENSDKGALHVLPHLYFFIKSYKNNDEEFFVNGNLNQLTNWYTENVNEVINTPLSAELIQIAKDITAPYKDEKEKVKAIYYWVQENIRYIAFEAGRDGFVPRNPSDVLSKRYGDCKDMASVIYGLTKAVEIPTNLTWVGTRDLPYSYKECPFTFTDNHMIATYTYNDSTYVLDATSSFQPWGIPTSMIQTKSILIRDDKGAFRVHNVPVYQPVQKTIIDTTYLQLKGASLVGKSKVYFNGYSKVDLYYAFHTAENEKEKALRVMQLANRSTNNVNATFLNSTNLNARDSSAVVNYEFSISKYVITAANKTYITLFLDPEELIYFDPKKRKNSYDLEYLQCNEHVILFDLPENTTVKELPAPVIIKNNIAEFEIYYKQISPKQIQCVYKMSNMMLTITPNHFQEYSDLVSQLKKIASQKITLINPS
jgi:hypothetical protein